MIRFILFITLCIISFHQSLSAQSSSEELAAKLDSSLTELVKLLTEVKDIHPCLKEFYPIAVPYADSLLIFDYNSVSGRYSFVKETVQPFPLPDGIQASFPLSDYDNRPTCIVSPETFKSKSGYVTVMHEFIHCCQYSSVETGLKQSLEVYNKAMKKKDYSWEITYSFPYGDSMFIDYYNRFKTALERDSIESAKQYRIKLKAYLNRTDFEYMLWEEWKEGLARYVENKINDRLKLNRNDYGKDEPYNRVSFYYSGELFITRLTEVDPGLAGEMKSLFMKMKNF